MSDCIYSKAVATFVCSGFGQISLNFNKQVSFKDLYTKQCVCSHKQKYIKHIEQNFRSVAWVMPQGWDLGV